MCAVMCPYDHTHQMENTAVMSGMFFFCFKKIIFFLRIYCFLIIKISFLFNETILYAYFVLCFCNHLLSICAVFFQLLFVVFFQAILVAIDK